MKKPNSTDEKDDSKLSDKDYTKQLRKLQAVELCHLQGWATATGARIMILFEGRDTAGKGGIIKAIQERGEPAASSRVVALPAPSDREKTQMFMQRYIAHFPAAGEIVILDRSWYNRAGVEYVMGFCSEEQRRTFLDACPTFEKWVTDAGVMLIKIWLEVGQEEQERRFMARITDPLRQWKLSDMDLKSYSKWYDYSRARDEMFKSTDTDFAPWHILVSDDKKRARLNGIAHILSLIPYKPQKREQAKLPKRSNAGAYDDAATLKGHRFIPAKY